MVVSMKSASHEGVNIVITGKQRNFAEIMAELEQIQKKQDEEAGRMADRPIPAQRKSPRSPKSRLNLCHIAHSCKSLS